MLKKNLLIFVTSILLCSCVSQSEHDKIIFEKDNIAQERDKLKQELDEIKFGAPNLLADGKKFYVANDFTQSRQKFQILLEKHPDMSQSIEAKKYLSSIDEDELWYNASTSEDLVILENYISKYSTGKYISKANVRQGELKILNKKKAYDLATNQNTSHSWKKFLEDYPNHEDSSAIRKQIIRLEVDEITGNKETGQMPTFNQLGSSYSSTSIVRITNNTGCDLTVRYSGPDVEIILIPMGSTRSVDLQSGSYKIAASACGANYAGSESLQGEYGSTFYISTTRN